MQWQIFYLPVTLKALFTKYIYFSVTLGADYFIMWGENSKWRIFAKMIT